MLENLHTVQWESLSQPEWNKADTIPNSLLKLAACSYEAGWHDAYSDFLFAVGNNHAGTYYPAVLKTFPFLREILIQGSNSSQCGVLNSLMELGTCFSPEAGYEFVEDFKGCRKELSLLLAQEIENLRPLISSLMTDASRDTETQQSAKELLELLQENDDET